MALLAMPFFAFTQVEFSGAIKAGAVTSQVGGDGLAGFDKFGLTGGPQLKMNWNDDWAVQMELLFVQKGSRKIPDTEAGDFNEFAIRLNYIEVPLSIQYEISKFSVGVGGYASVLIGSEVESNGQSYDPENYYQRDYESTDFGVFADVNYSFTEKFFANARFSQTVIPILPAPASTRPFWDRGQFNSVIQLMLGLSF